MHRSPTSAPRFRRLSAWLKERYGERVFKVSLRGGFTCPNRDGSLGTAGCAFCAPGALEPVGYGAGQGLSEQLSRGMDYIRQRHGARRFVAYFHDYTATYGPVERLRERFEVPLARPEVVALAMGTRPDCLDAPVLALLKELASRRDLWLELGLQIADDEILARLGRGHGVAAFVEAVRACHHHGLRVCTHVILGLPGVTEETERDTAALLGELGVWGVKLHAFHLIEGSPLAASHRMAALPLLSREAHAARVVAFLETLPPQTVIHRVTGEAPPRLTIAPQWTVNKLAVYDAVVEAMERCNTWQGRGLGSPRQPSGTSRAPNALFKAPPPSHL